MDTHTVAFPESQASPHSPVEESLLPHSPGPESKMSRVKVCPECGMVFYKTQSYVLHVRSHRPMLDCDECSYKTKDPKKLKTHQLTHKKKKPDKECYICHKYFLTDVTLRIHQKKIHGVHICKYCTTEYSTDQKLKNHMREQHGYTRKTKGYVVVRDQEQIEHQTSNEVPDIDKSHLICKFCKKVCRNEYLLNLHLAQHLGTSSKKISYGLLDNSDDLQKQKNECQVSNESRNSNVEFEPPVSPMTATFNATVKCEVVSDNDADTEDKDEVLPPVCNTFESPSTSLGQTLLFCNPVGQPLSNSTLQSPIPNATSELMRPEVIPAVGNTTVPNIPSGQSLLFCNPVGQPLPLMRPHFILPPPTLSTTDGLAGSPYTQATSAVCVPSVQPTTFQYNTTPALMSVPEVTPSTSFSTNSQTSATKIFIPAQESQTEKDKQYSPFWCMHCATAFPTPVDLKKHFWEVHPSQPIPKVLLPRIIKNQIFEERKRTVRKRHKIKRELPCDACGEVYYTSKQLRNHKKKHRKSFICPDCNTIYKSSHKLLRHQKLIHKDKYRCRFACGILFDSYSEVINHYKKVHDKDYSRIECPHCHKGFVYEASLMNHLEKCTDCPPDKRPAHVCGNCEGFFRNIDAYNKHAKICLPSLKKKDVRKNNAESAPDNWAVNTTNILENYESTSDHDSTSDSNESSVEEHNANKPYEFRHRRSTTTEYSNCKYCPNILIEKDKEVHHILSWHKDVVARMTDAPRKCEICGIIFKIDKALCKHLLTHYSKLNMWDALVPENILKLVTVKNYCWICKSTYKWPQNTDHGVGRDLRIDEALEVEEFDETVALKCEECNQSYSSRKEFWRHVKNHISVLPRKVFESKLPQKIQPNSFECAECQYKCRNMKELYKHLTGHFMEEIKEKTTVSEKTDKDSINVQINQDTDKDSIDVQINQDTDKDSIIEQINQDRDKDSIGKQISQDGDKNSINVQTNQDVDKNSIDVQINQNADKDGIIEQINQDADKAKQMSKVE